jgi:hypothetical protein
MAQFILRTGHLVIQANSHFQQGPVEKTCWAKRHFAPTLGAILTLRLIFQGQPAACWQHLLISAKCLC